MGVWRSQNEVLEGKWERFRGLALPKIGERSVYSRGKPKNMAENSAKDFIERWTGRGDEKSDTQLFWIDLLGSVFGFDDPTKLVEFEKRVKLEDSTRFIDVYIPYTRTLIEQKSLGIDLSKPASQSGGDFLTPYGQARRYDNNLPVDQKARWIICCNFERFELHDMRRPLDPPEVVLLKDLEKGRQRLSCLSDAKVGSIRREEEISFKAGKIVGELYDLILPQYKDPNNPYSLKSLNQLCVRLVFCLYAEDVGLFGEKDKFYNYLKDLNPGRFRKALLELFEVFDTPYSERDEYIDPTLASFPYIRGGIFEGDIEIPLFTEEIIDKLLQEASLGLDWSDISPTIFGAVFESTLNPQTRRSGGMHYTSEENIHKVIGPLFLDALTSELRGIEGIKVKAARDKALRAFQEKIAGLQFLDPACGSGNFLTETYLSLRRLENRVLELLGMEGILYLGDEFSPIKVTISQFYGMEINDFAVSVAKTALWIAESQMMKQTEHIVGRPLEYFPLRENPNIVEGNALRLDWNEVIPNYELDYIMGNPPFVGARVKSKEQAFDLEFVFGKKWKNLGNLDYVGGWYKTAADYIAGTSIKAAFVSTNSIVQGEQVPALWKPLMSEYGIHIDFAYRSFVWDSEASLKAHVHCVIIGFSTTENVSHKTLFDKNGEHHTAVNINPYLIDGPDIFIESRTSPICEVPEMVFGSMPNDGGFLSDYSPEEKNVIVKEYPQAAPLFKRLLGSVEFINGKERWCLWLKGVSPICYKDIPPITEAVRQVRNMRLESNRESTKRLADVPMLFGEIRQSEKDYLLVPRVSSENRQYIPMGFIPTSVIANDSVLTVPNASLYDFGILTSSVHMAWVRKMCGRLKSDYRYSAKIVYNNFPWPNPSEDWKERIALTAQKILDARKLYEGCTMADMYGADMFLYSQLLKAHRENDRAVMEAYGFDPDMSEEQIVSELLKMYEKIAKGR